MSPIHTMTICRRHLFLFFFVSLIFFVCVHSTYVLLLSFFNQFFYFLNHVFVFFMCHVGRWMLFALFFFVYIWVRWCMLLVHCVRFFFTLLIQYEYGSIWVYTRWVMFNIRHWTYFMCVCVCLQGVKNYRSLWRTCSFF